jgi:hypothetical protein
MRKLTPPTYDARSTFELCADNVGNKALSTKLHTVAAEIESAEKLYKEQGEKASLFSIPEADMVGGVVTLAEMKALYKNTLSHQESDARYIYDAIKAAPKSGICPLCGQRVVATLDHYLAQSRHAAYTVTPLNLIPSCFDCNWSKRAHQPSRASEQTLHPYFDDVDQDVWLVANLLASDPPALTFSARPPASWDDVKRERLTTHFRTLKLGALYSAHSAEELRGMHENYRRVADREGAQGLRTYLQEHAEGRRKTAINSWQAAMYEALGASDWFCQEGYNLVQ